MTPLRQQSTLLEHVGRHMAESFERDLRARLGEASERNLALLDVAAAAHDARMKAMIADFQEMMK